MKAIYPRGHKPRDLDDGRRLDAVICLGCVLLWPGVRDILPFTSMGNHRRDISVVFAVE